MTGKINQNKCTKGCNCFHNRNKFFLKNFFLKDTTSYSEVLYLNFIVRLNVTATRVTNRQTLTASFIHFSNPWALIQSTVTLLYALKSSLRILSTYCEFSGRSEAKPQPPVDSATSCGLLQYTLLYLTVWHALCRSSCGTISPISPVVFVSLFSTPFPFK
jgi:hypothetical protein